MAKKILLFASIFFLSIKVIIDTDYGWHVRVGEFIVNNRFFPKVDLFSFTLPDYPYIYHSWGSEVLMYLSFKLGGLIGSSILFAAVLTLSLFFLYLASNILSKDRINFLFFLWVTPLAYSVAGGRTRVFGFLFLSIVYYLFLKFHLEKSKAIWFIPLVFVLWANSHGSFPLGIFVLMMFAGMLFLKKEGENARVLFFATIVSTLATLINPYFVDSWIQSVKIVVNSFAIKSINLDWKPLFGDGGSGWISALMVLTLTFIFRKKGILIVLPLTIFLAFSLVSSKVAFALLVFFIPAANDLFVNWWKNITRKRGVPLTIRASIASIVLVLPLFGLLNLLEINSAYKSYKDYGEFLKTKVPGSVNYETWSYGGNKYINDNLLDRRVLNDGNWGGFMLLMNPNRKVFGYGAMDNFIVDGNSFAKYYVNFISAGPNYEDVLDKYKIEAVFLPKYYPVIEKLSDWKNVYEDDQAVVLVKN